MMLLLKVAGHGNQGWAKGCLNSVIRLMKGTLDLIAAGTVYRGVYVPRGY